MSIKPQYDGIVICSTQNQMVNYVTILHHAQDLENVDIINLTFDKKNKPTRQDNSAWDENLETVLGRKFEKTIPLGMSQLADHSQIKKEISNGIKEKYQDKRLLWNITGGQRHIVMGITEFVNAKRPNDCIVYFEGDQSKFYYYYPTQKVEQSTDALRTADFKVDSNKLNLNIAFGLMGFKVGNKSKKMEEYWFLTSNSEDEFKESCPGAIKKWQDYKDEEKFFVEFYDQYANDDTCHLFRYLRGTNDKDDNEEARKKLAAEKFLLREYGSRTGIEILTKNVQGKNFFGYVLERMVFYKMINILKEKKLSGKITDILLSVRITKEKTSLGVIDEFDISILTKSGKVIIFECKSGKNTTGDHIKSHHYSTYAVSGVYGTPILITPLVVEKHKRGIDNDIEKAIAEYEKLRDYALKASVDFWYLGDLEKNLEALLKGGL